MKDNTQDRKRAAPDGSGPLEEQLAEWGRKLDEMRGRVDEIGKDTVSNLEDRYSEVRARAKAMAEMPGNVAAGARQKAGEAQEKATLTVENVTDAAQEQIDGVKARRDEIQSSVSAAKDGIAQSATNVGDNMQGSVEDVRAGLEMAWTAMREAFDSAGERLRHPTQK